MKGKHPNLIVARGAYLARWKDPITHKNKSKTIGYVGLDDEDEMGKKAADIVRRAKSGKLEPEPVDEQAAERRKVIDDVLTLAAGTPEEDTQTRAATPTTKKPVHKPEPQPTTIPLDRVGHVARMLWASANDNGPSPAPRAVRALSRALLWPLLILCTGMQGDDLRKVRVGDIGETEIDGERVKAIKVSRGENSEGYTVPLYGIAEMCIDRMLELRAAEPEPSPYLWRTPTDQEPIEPHMLGVIWRFFVKRELGPEYSITPKDIRRTAAALLLDDGVDPLLVDCVLYPGARRRNALQNASYVAHTSTIAPAFRRLAGIVGRLMVAEDYAFLPDGVRQAHLFEAGLSGTKEEPRP